MSSSLLVVSTNQVHQATNMASENRWKVSGFIPVSQAFTLVEACKPIIMVLMDLETKTISKPKIAVKVSLPSSHFLSCSIVSLSIYTHSSINEKSEHKRMGITTSLSYLLFFNIILPTLTASPILFQGFNWESSKKQGGWYNFLINSIPELSASGITHVWLPPPSQSNASEGKNQYIENLLDSFII
ncbi:unnamed protein product, partial [Vitis vinifera]